MPTVEFVPALGGATFDQPVDVGDYGDGRTFVAERGGRVWLADDAGSRDLLVDLSGVVDAVRGEGLLSVALVHPSIRLAISGPTTLPAAIHHGRRSFDSPSPTT
ncbi:MAG: hypothetical protein O2924_03935 [Chloroflexi bacterium]|nr:hypothetical protein [Chloroflexota bacterium]